MPLRLRRLRPYTCPVCGHVTADMIGAREQWCDRCCGYTSEKPLPGFRWVMFRGGILDGRGVQVSTHALEEGAIYTHSFSPEAWIYDGAEFQLNPDYPTR